MPVFMPFQIYLYQNTVQILLIIILSIYNLLNSLFSLWFNTKQIRGDYVYKRDCPINIIDNYL